MRGIALFVLLAIGASAVADDKEEPPCYRLMDTTYQQAIMRKHRIPDAHEWNWYGLPLGSAQEKKIVHWFGQIIRGNEYEIQVLFHWLGKEPHEISNAMESMRFYRHPQYVELLRWMTDTYVQHPGSFVRPKDKDIDVAYQNAYENAEQRYAVGFDDKLDTETICQAARDAAGFFFWRNRFGYVDRHMAVLDRYGCAGDFTPFVTGEPQPLLKAIQILDAQGLLPEGYVETAKETPKHEDRKPWREWRQSKF